LHSTANAFRALRIVLIIWPRIVDLSQLLASLARAPVCPPVFIALFVRHGNIISQ
jgi:hypothetical protein